MTLFQEKAKELFNSGYSCSETIIRAAYEQGMLNQKENIEFLNQLASSFSGGMGENGCLCGAVAGAQMVIGSIFGRKDKNTSPKNIKAVSKEFIDKFKEKRKATCCKVLSAGFDFHSPERRENCLYIVNDAAELLESHVKENLHKIESNT